MSKNKDNGNPVFISDLVVRKTRRKSKTAHIFDRYYPDYDPNKLVSRCGVSEERWAIRLPGDDFKQCRACGSEQDFDGVLKLERDIRDKRRREITTKEEQEARETEKKVAELREFAAEALSPMAGAQAQIINTSIFITFHGRKYVVREAKIDD